MDALFSNEHINELIVCEKVLKSKPKKPVEKNRNLDQRSDVYGKDNDELFRVFVTQSTQMQQEFSIGLMYENHLLIRVNGFHGTTKAGFYTAEHHKYPHAQILTEEDIKSSRELTPSHIEDLTGKFSNLSYALLYFFERCNIINYQGYFDLPNKNQMSFLDGEW